MQVGCGNGFTCAALADGTAWCWGAGSEGELGNGTTTFGSRPVQVSGLTNVVGIASGQGQNCALPSARRAAREGMRDAPLARMRTVRDIMETEVHWLPSDMPLERAARELASREITGAPVCDPDGKVVGMLSTTDLTEFYGGVNELRLVRDVMTPDVLAVRPDDPMQRAIEMMAFEGVHRLVVIDGQDLLAGIVTSMDVMRELAGFQRPRRTIALASPP